MVTFASLCSDENKHFRDRFNEKVVKFDWNDKKVIKDNENVTVVEKSYQSESVTHGKYKMIKMTNFPMKIKNRHSKLIKPLILLNFNFNFIYHINWDRFN